MNATKGTEQLDMDEQVVRESIEKESKEVEQQEEGIGDTVVATLVQAVSMVADRIKGCDAQVDKVKEDCENKLVKAKEDYDAQVEKIKEDCDSQLEQIEEKRCLYEEQLRNAVQQMQGQFQSYLPKTRKPRREPAHNGTKTGPGAPRGRRHDKSVKTLILDYLEKHRQARTSEIRDYLQKIGRPSNPGVELSRLVKKGDILNKERGLYTLPSRRQ